MSDSLRLTKRRGLDIPTVQGMPEGFQSVIEAGLQVGRKVGFVLIVDDLGVIRENAVEDLLRLQRVQHRLEGVIYGQQMGNRTARCQRQHHLTVQGAFRKQIEQRF